MENEKKYLKLNIDYKNWLKNNYLTGFQGPSYISMYDYIDKNSKKVYECIEEDMYVEYKKNGGIKMVINGEKYYGYNIMDYESLLLILNKIFTGYSENQRGKLIKENVNIYNNFSNCLSISDLNDNYIGIFKTNKFKLIKNG